MRYLIVTADDFGRDATTNSRIVQAHTAGILTATSLMVHEVGAQEAVEMARATPSLDVGLHLTLSEGLAGDRSEAYRGLVVEGGRFRPNPATAGLAYFFRRSLRRQIGEAVRAQFARFATTGLKCSHADGHQHLHIHPVIWRDLVACCLLHGVRWVRIPWEPWLARGHPPVGRRLEWLAVRGLARWCRRDAKRHGLRYCDHVYGHLHSGNMDEERLLHTLRRLREGLNEIYVHPGASQTECDAVMSHRVKMALPTLGVKLLRFRDAEGTDADGTS